MQSIDGRKEIATGMTTKNTRGSARLFALAPAFALAAAAFAGPILSAFASDESGPATASSAAPGVPPGGEKTAAPEKGPMELSAYFDAYYLQSPQAQSSTTGTGPSTILGRAFDRSSGALTVNFVELSARRRFKAVTARVDLAFGDQVDALSSATEPTRNIAQATLTYVPLERMQVTIGKFYSFTGYETPKAVDNWQYSRSFAANTGSPAWHEGLGVSYALIPDKLSAAVYLVNGWDGRISEETNKSPSVGASLTATVAPELNLTYNYLGGLEAGTYSVTGTGSSTVKTAITQGRRDFHELGAVYGVLPRLSLAADYIMAMQKNAVGSAASSSDAKWSSLALYLKAQLLPWYRLSPRFEMYDDSDQGYSIGGVLGTATPVKQKLTSWTLTNGFDLGDGLEARLELRADRSDTINYFKSSDGTPSDHQESVTVAVLYQL